MPLIAGHEDDPEVAWMLGEIVKGAGWDWHHLPDGPEAIDTIRSLRPDLVTTGNRQTVMGPRFLKLMRDVQELRSIPVVFVTPLWQDVLWDAIRREGLDPETEVAGYVKKPFDVPEFVAELGRVLGAAQAQPRTET